MFPCYLGKCHAASTEGINYAVLYTRILVRLYTYFHFLRDLLTCEKLSFLRRIFTIVAEGKKSVEAGGANVGFPFVKWFVQTVFCSLTWKPSGPFETFLSHCSRFSGFLGKWCHLVSFYMFPFPLLFGIPWVVVAASPAASIYWHNWAFFRNLICILILIQFWFIQTTWLT